MSDAGESTTSEKVGDEEVQVAAEERESTIAIMEGAMRALRTSSHAVEIGCGLGVSGLTYAAAVAAEHDDENRRTIAFLDREPYALHCVMASASTNGIATGPLIAQPVDAEAQTEDSVPPIITARAAIDDWTLPMVTGDETDEGTSSPIKNVCYRDLHLEALHSQNRDTVLLASDILYEPLSMKPLATKLKSLLHPIRGGYALIADPERERTRGCRDAFVEAVRSSGGEVCVLPMPDLENGNDSMTGGSGGANDRMTLLESDVDIDGSLARTVLIVVHFDGSG